jgi:hypothetical protein
MESPGARGWSKADSGYGNVFADSSNRRDLLKRKTEIPGEPLKSTQDSEIAGREACYRG